MNIDVLLEWFTKNGGYMDGFKIGFNKDGIRGLIATKEIKQNKCIIAVPYNLAITPKLAE